MRKVLHFTNMIAFMLMIFSNYLANTGLISNYTIGEISDKYNNLFTPAGYAFSIWGFIYLGLLAFTIYQAKGLFKKSESDEAVLLIGWWFVVSCLANSFWIIFWLTDNIGLSVLAMILLMFSLVKIIINTRMELDDEALPRIAFVWWPFSLYSGWIAVALVANVAAYLTKINWNGFGFSELFWAIFMVIVATAINLFLTWTRNMREFALVGVWALVAIAAANWNEEESLVQISFILAAILFVSSNIHAYRNRETNPFKTYFKNKKT
jgi:hypothetical protein